MNPSYKVKPAQVVCAFLITALFIIPGSASISHALQNETKHSMNSDNAIVYVDGDNAEGPWDGSIQYPYRYIQDGIDNAEANETVYVFHEVYVENVVVPKPLCLIGENKDNTIITGNDFGTVVRLVAGNVTLKGFTIRDCGSNSNDAGIKIHSSFNIVKENNIENNNNYGLYVAEIDNLIYHNNILHNKFQAIDLFANSTWDGGYPCGGNFWSDYTGTDEDEDGIGDAPYLFQNASADHYPLIHPYGSIFNQDTEEIFITIQGAIGCNDTQDGQVIIVKNGVYWEHLWINKSIVLQGQDHHDTIIDGRSSCDVVTICACDVVLHGFLIQRSGVEEQNAGVVIIGKNCSITNNIIYGNYQGIVVRNSAVDSTISKNEIMKNNWNGISITSGCKGVHISENTISDNFYAGIGISESSNNFIIHNAFQANRIQAYDNGNNIWDNGYPSGGNYWSDYTGTDTNGDGIGDTPYPILNGINTDRFPLIAPFTEIDTIPPVVKILSPEKGLYLKNLRLLSGLIRRQTIIFGAVTIEVEASDAQSGIARIEFYIDDIDNLVFNDTLAPYEWSWTQRQLLKHKHTIIVVAVDNAGNENADMLDVQKFL